MAEHQSPIGIGAEAYGVLFGGFVGSESLKSFFYELAGAPEEFSGTLSGGNDKLILVSIGNKILSNGHVNDSYIIGASDQLYDHLKQKTFETGRCNIERLKSTSGQKISWVVSEVNHENEHIARHCIALALSIFMELDFLKMSELSTLEIIKEIKANESTRN